MLHSHTPFSQIFIPFIGPGEPLLCQPMLRYPLGHAALREPRVRLCSFREGQPPVGSKCTSGHVCSLRTSIKWVHLLRDVCWFSLLLLRKVNELFAVHCVSLPIHYDYFVAYWFRRQSVVD